LFPKTGFSLSTNEIQRVKGLRIMGAFVVLGLGFFAILFIALLLVRKWLKAHPSSSAHTPPLGFHFLTSFYDVVISVTCREATFRRALLSQACLHDKQVVLDVGCGTGSLLLLLKQLFPAVNAIGVDADVEALGIAASKCLNKVELRKGFGQQLPVESGTVDFVLSSLFFHHLSTEDKVKTLAEMYRVLKLDGELHVADWGKPTNFLMRIAFLPVQILDGFDTTRDSVIGALPDLMKVAGFQIVKETKTLSTFFGTISLYVARKK
jgi:SAM-dependent methyltransferase